MAITERARRDLYDGLEAVLGPQPASDLMELLPDQPATQLVTIPLFQSDMAVLRSDLSRDTAHLRTEIRDEMNEFRTEMRGEMNEFRTEMRGEMNEFRVEIKDEMGEFRTELSKCNVEIANLRSEFTDRFAQTEAKITRWFVTSTAANMIAVVTALSV